MNAFQRYWEQVKDFVLPDPVDQNDSYDLHGRQSTSTPGKDDPSGDARFRANQNLFGGSQYRGRDPLGLIFGSIWNYLADQEEPQSGPTALTDDFSGISNESPLQNFDSPGQYDPGGLGPNNILSTSPLSNPFANIPAYAKMFDRNKNDPEAAQQNSTGLNPPGMDPLTNPKSTAKISAHTLPPTASRTVMTAGRKMQLPYTEEATPDYHLGRGEQNIANYLGEY